MKMPGKGTESPKAVQPSRAVFPVWAWVAAVALAILTGYTIRQMGNQSAQLAALRQQMKLAMVQNKTLQDQLEVSRQIAFVMTSPDSLPLQLAPSDKNRPMMRAYVHTHMGIAITAEQMPSMPATRTLQLWFRTKDGKLMSIAIFHPDAQGQVAIIAPTHIPRNEIAALAITEEPAGGSPQPTSDPAWTAQVK
ncbi:MAG TPA: anti-sigma factor [Candidatus Acidoferrales bacterium]|nr:anti-sigma factor [Candidatus Acidoferrales bacterium]